MKYLKNFNERIYGWSYPPGAAGDPNAPWNQDYYIFDLGSELLYEILIEKGFNNEDAENISNEFVNDDNYVDLIDEYSESPEIGWNKETESPIYSDEYINLLKEAEKLYPRNYKLQRNYIKREMLKLTLNNVINSTEFQKWLKDNGYVNI